MTAFAQATADVPAQRILVMGAGAIGGVLTSNLTEIGADVTAITTNEHIERAVRAASSTWGGWVARNTVS